MAATGTAGMALGVGSVAGLALRVTAREGVRGQGLCALWRLPDPTLKRQCPPPVTCPFLTPWGLG